MLFTLWGKPYIAFNGTSRKSTKNLSNLYIIRRTMGCCLVFCIIRNNVVHGSRPDVIKQLPNLGKYCKCYHMYNMGRNERFVPTIFLCIKKKAGYYFKRRYDVSLQITVSTISFLLRSSGISSHGILCRIHVFFPWILEHRNLLFLLWWVNILHRCLSRL